MIVISKIKQTYKKIFEKKDEKELRLIKTKLRNTECKYKVYIEDSKKLANKVAIVTGGSGAIGSAISFKLAMEGANVIVCGRNKNTLNSVKQQIEDNNGKCEILELDITNYSDIKEKINKIYEKYNQIDILVNAAGGSAREKAKKIESQDITVINDVISSNLLGTIYCCKETANYMKKRNNGKIINFGSTVGIGGLCNYSDYCAAKSGIIGFTRSLAMELAEYNINVNCVTPGITNQILWDEPLRDIPVKTSYIKRKGKTMDIANAVAFLVSDDANYIIGQNIIVDGGRSLGLKGE